MWTGDGANFGEGIAAIGGGVDNGRLEGVLPAAAFFSTCIVNNVIKFNRTSNNINITSSNPSMTEVSNLS